MNDLPQRIDWVGWECGHCHSHNTVVEVYDTGPEGNCLSCSRPFTLTEEMKKDFVIKR